MCGVYMYALVCGNTFVVCVIKVMNHRPEIGMFAHVRMRSFFRVCRVAASLQRRLHALTCHPIRRGMPKMTVTPLTSVV